MMGDPVAIGDVDHAARSSPPLSIDRLDDAHGTTLWLSGELDLSSAGELEAAIGDAQANGRGPLTLDLAALTFMDSTGTAVLARAHRAGTEAGRPMILAHLGNQVRRVLELLGMLEQFNVRD